MNSKTLAVGLWFVLACMLIDASAAVKQDASPLSLQKLVDNAEPDSAILLGPGTYSGPVAINKPVLIDGKGSATVDGRGIGRVITINADGVRIRNLRIINSGDRHDLIDAAISLVDSSGCEIAGNRIENCLFGIHLQNSHDNLIKDNDISSKPHELGLRGDGVWVWWSDNNTFSGNRIKDARDFVVWYSVGNVIENNTGLNCRYSLHFMFSDSNYVRNNHYENNSVGIYNMYSDGIIIEGNTIIRSLGATGMGIGLKEASDAIIKDNKILYCSRGIAIDQSPFEPDTGNYCINNELIFNNEAVSFVTDGTRINNVFEGNIFKWNILDVTVSGTRGVAKGLWNRNYWDKYEGFDTDGDGTGDTPYRYYIYADQLWLNNPALQFFRGSIVMSFLEFLQRLAPFSQPELALEDDGPLKNPVKSKWKDEAQIVNAVKERTAEAALLRSRIGRQGALLSPAELSHE